MRHAPAALEKRGLDQISRCFFLLVLSVLALAACAAPQARETSALPQCEGQGLRLHADFPGSSIHHCQFSDDRVVITIAPEYHPINPSPWYAYRLESNTARSLKVVHHYREASHRYSPWMSRDGENWLPLATSVPLATSNEFDYTLDLETGWTWVAAQPVLTRETSLAWADALAQRHALERHVVATTLGQNPVVLFDSTGEAGQPLLVLLGRAHPPEVTGAFAMQDFTERLFDDDELATEFRRRFRIAVIPLLNPDGVERGHWRGNSRGVDLNRDWGPFTQEETRGVSAWLQQAQLRNPPIVLLDFHSTSKDVLYTPHPGDHPHPAGFDKAWIAALANRLGDEMPEVSGGHNPALPTTKSWARRIYGITAITYEVGDTTPRAAIRHKAVIAAEELMRLLPRFSAQPAGELP